jgi:monofunctional biosynthetic peptidoglycan transglycosylase
MTRRDALAAAALALLATARAAASAKGTPGMTATTIDLAVDGAAWQVVNDGVMGGVSESTITAGANGVSFSGTLRTEYNGGFASARRAVDATLLRAAVDAAGGDAPAGFSLAVRGDGHRYRLTIYPGDGQGGVRDYAYFAEFDTDGGGELSLTLRWPQFRASFRGRPVPEAPSLAWRDVAGVGLMLTKAGHREGRGSFALQLTSLRPASA